MIGASIYGFVDYKKTSQRKEFRSLYVDKEVKEPAITKKNIIEAVEIKEPAVKEKDQVIKNTEPVQKNLTVKTVKESHKKKLSYKLFSRAPLDSRYLYKELKSDELNKSEPGKTVRTDLPKENKEQ